MRASQMDHLILKCQSPLTKSKSNSGRDGSKLRCPALCCIDASPCHSRCTYRAYTHTRRYSHRVQSGSACARHAPGGKDCCQAHGLCMVQQRLLVRSSSMAAYRSQQRRKKEKGWMGTESIVGLVLTHDEQKSKSRRRCCCTTISTAIDPFWRHSQLSF